MTLQQVWLRAAALVAALFACASGANADILLSNIGATPTALGGTLISGATVKDAGFAMPPGAGFLLTGVVLRTEDALGAPTPEVSVWWGTGSPTQLLAVLDNPPSIQTGEAYFGLGSAPLLLSPGTEYWIRVRAVGTGSFVWSGVGGSGPLPTGVALHTGFRFNGSPSATRNIFQVEGVFAAACIDFNSTPGADRFLGSPDDAPIAAPIGFAAQTSQVTTEDRSQGVVFLPNPPLNDRNEILNNASFPLSTSGAGPNLLASSAGAEIRAAFTRRTYAVSMALGLAPGGGRVEFFDADGTLLGTRTATDAVVTFTSTTPIAGMRAVNNSVSGGTIAIDRLCLGFVPPPPCLADINSDGVVDADDFFAYLSLFAAGCP